MNLLASPHTPDRDRLALLVADIASGRGYCEVHFARQRINPFTRKPLEPDFDLDGRLEEERRVVAEIRSRGEAAVPLLLPFLHHDDADFRAEIARALACYSSSSTSKALEEALKAEPDAHARGVMQAALVEIVRAREKLQ